MLWDSVNTSISFSSFITHSPLGESRTAGPEREISLPGPHIFLVAERRQVLAWDVSRRESQAFIFRCSATPTFFSKKYDELMLIS
jgi:hypothetical protein